MEGPGLFIHAREETGERHSCDRCEKAHPVSYLVSYWRAGRQNRLCAPCLADVREAYGLRVTVMWE